MTDEFNENDTDMTGELTCFDVQSVAGLTLWESSIADLDFASQDEIQENFDENEEAYFDIAGQSCKKCQFRGVGFSKLDNPLEKCVLARKLAEAGKTF